MSPLSARVPNEDDLRYNIFTNLAYGSKGLMYFTYKTSPYPYFIDGIIRPDGTRYQSYEWARKLNEQLLHLGPTLKRLTSREVYHHSPGNLPRGTTALPQDFSWQPNQANVPQIISTFHDEEGTIYIMVVNRDINVTGGPSPGNRTLTFNLDSSINHVVEISKESGQEIPALFNASTGVLSAEFAPGEGKLYKTNLRADLNRQPVAYSLYKELVDLHAVEGSLNAVDPDGDALAYTLLGNPVGGEVTLGSDGTFTFTPNSSFDGAGSFTYIVGDGKASSNPATVTVALAQGQSGLTRVPTVKEAYLSPGSTVGTTVIAAQPEDGNTIRIQVVQAPMSAPVVGSVAQQWPAYDGDEVPATIGEYIAVYEVAATNEIVGFSLLPVKQSSLQTRIGVAFNGQFPIGVHHVVKSQEGAAFTEQVNKIKAMNANLMITSDSVESIGDQQQLLQEAGDAELKVLAGHEYAPPSVTVSQPEVNMVYGILPWHWHGQLFRTPANSSNWSLEAISLNTQINAAQPLENPVRLELAVYESPDRTNEIARASLVLGAGESGERMRQFEFSGATLEPDKVYYMQLMTDTESNIGIGYYNQAGSGYDKGGAYFGGHATQHGEFRNYEDLAYELTLTDQAEEAVFAPDRRPSDAYWDWLSGELGRYDALLGYSLQRRAFSPLYDQLAAAASYLKSIDANRLSYVSLPGVDRNGGFLNPSQLIRERVRTKPGQTSLQSIKMSNGLSTNIWAPARVNVYDAVTASLIGQSEQIYSRPTDSQPIFTFTPALALDENTEYIFELDLDQGYEGQVWTNWRIDPYGTLEVDGQLKGGRLFTTINGEEHYDQIKAWMAAATASDLLVMDSYNYHHGGVQLDNYFLLLDQFSKEAKKNGVPLWATVQSAAETFQPVPVPVPSQGQMCFQAYAALAYGAKGLLYSAYASDNRYTNALVNNDGSEAASYNWAQQLNNEIGHLGEVLLQLELDRVYHAYPGNDIPELGVSKMQADDLVQLPANTSRAMISTFTDNKGKRYWMVVNKDTENAHEFMFTIPSAPAQVMEISKANGERVPVEHYDDTSGTFSATLSAGEGRLYEMTYALSASDDHVSVKQGETYKGNLPARGLIYSTVEHPSHGMVYLDSSTGGFEYVPDQGAQGSDSFRYQVSNGSEVETATVYVNIVPYAPAIAGGAAIAIHNGEVSITATPGENERLVLKTSKEQMYKRSIERFKTPHVGDPVPVGSDVIDHYTGGNLDLATDLPLGEGSYIGVYVVGDDNAIKAFSLLRYTTNHAPVAQNVSLDAYIGQVTQGALVATDEDEDTLTFRILDQPAKGTVRLDRHSNQFIYTPKTGASGTDTFTYYAIDGKDRSNYATVTIAIHEEQGGGNVTPPSGGGGTTPPGNGGNVTPPSRGGGTTPPGNGGKEKPVDNGGEEIPLGSNIKFNDIQGHWAEASIIEAAHRGIIVGFGDGTFRPQQAVTRAQFIVMVQRALRFDGSESNRSFPDLQTVGAWAHSRLLKAVEAGWLTGYPDGTLRPNAPLTRTEMAIVIARALELQPGDAQHVSFADAEDIPIWGKAAVEAARRNGLLRGQGSNRFNPGAATTRAEAATLMLRLLSWSKGN
ncbi:Ig-like domain-containing protein [Paenibacillus sp. GCM10027626]|uniref:Ig-like domain-containing protein n=1 Tax=Paenibacillus sp. GCM10027626 TaxID=3273411 RepID=UPI00362760A6